MMPNKSDARGCVDDIASIFESSDSSVWSDGYVGRWWILDVDGNRIVVMTDCENGCTEDDLDTLTQMAQSITFTRGD